jgi:hypothetical protein
MRPLKRTLLNGASCAMYEACVQLTSLNITPIRRLWILPEPVDMSQVPVAVLDVAPRKRWNHGSHRFFWHEEEMECPPNSGYLPTRLLGMARIQYGCPELGGGEEPHGTALVIFGSHGELASQLPWCFLVVETGSKTDLAQAFARLSSGDWSSYCRLKSNLSSAPVGEGLVLQAVARREKVTDADYFLLQIGVVGAGRPKELSFWAL